MVVITANRLADGAVVFLGRALHWVATMQDALVLSSGDSAGALRKAQEDEARQLVVEPYAVDVLDADGAIIAKARREAIRALGPTVRPDLAKPRT